MSLTTSLSPAEKSTIWPALLEAITVSRTNVVASDKCPVPHAFSHYRLTLWPRAWRGLALRARVRDNADLRWCAREDWDALGIPAPIRTLLQGMR